LVVTDPAAQRALWRIREDASGTATRMPDGAEAWPGWEDCAVPPARLGAYLRDFRGLLRAHDLRGTPYGHFGDGCIHVRIDFDLLTPAGIARFRRFSEEMAEIVTSHGGSLSGEHGDGQARAELLPTMYGTEMVRLFEQVKGVWDPDDLLNPGMLVRPAPLDSNLRFAVLPRTPVPVEFAYPDDGGDFSAAVRRCVGVAKCRTTEVSPASGAVMCPSFRATGEEEHSTRGRARLLHEMLAGELVTDGWRSPEVRDALDLCLSCKGCRSDCPVGVDMATYKAEFLHHHYAGRRRPAAHYAMGWLPLWLRLIARTRTAALVNLLANARPSASLAKRLGGIAGERELPRLARVPFTRWYEQTLGERERPQGAGEEPAPPTTVLLWADTFTEYLSPSVGQAALKVLEAAGLRVIVPPTRWTKRKPARVRRAEGGEEVALTPPRLSRALSAMREGRVCCGLTYVSTGQLDRARAVLRRTLDMLDVLDVLMGPVPQRQPAHDPAQAHQAQTQAHQAQGPATAQGPDPAQDPALAPPPPLPVVVLEPSCAATLRTDLPELLPDDPRAHRLAASVITFAEALERHAPHWTPPAIGRPVVGQTHCHQHAVLGDAPDRRLRAAAGLTGDLGGGCCGLAGNFGFEKGHYDVSVACAEDQLLPAVRDAAEDALVLADGFSCRTQLEQLAGRRGSHLAEVLAEGLSDGHG
ncbi:MAG TPA: FAD-linked oxidase C-terminal domain-containing protein, partial [Streptomyces sp.]|nr:FAD-linked oxidase C-terminal domain-containing protein [Streptomyces sp.]